VLIKNIPVVSSSRLVRVVRAGATCDRNATGYADLSDGSDTSTNRVIDRMIDRVRHVSVVIVSRQENLS